MKSLGAVRILGHLRVRGRNKRTSKGRKNPVITKEEDRWGIRMETSPNMESIMIEASPNMNEIMVPPLIIIGLIGHIGNAGTEMIMVPGMMDLDSTEITVVLAGGRMDTEIIGTHISGAGIGTDQVKDLIILRTPPPTGTKTMMGICPHRRIGTRQRVFGASERGNLVPHSLPRTY